VTTTWTESRIRLADASFAIIHTDYVLTDEDPFTGRRDCLSKDSSLEVTLLDGRKLVVRGFRSVEIGT